MSTNPTLGWHWIARASACDAQLDDLAAVETALRHMVSGLALRAVAEPIVRATDSGVAGVVLLAESHLAIHTVPSSREALVDLFSCAVFDAPLAAVLLRDALGAGAVDSQLITREAT